MYHVNDQGVDDVHDKCTLLLLFTRMPGEDPFG